ncbi:thioredoxin family protein [Salinimicrobium sp. GXAS 041]|uniref:thioredoxin family protein n=1 Tax=Salinimicrobium sp. GXAS 041 TaxID=3400806 RepID=UPI003C74E17F
MKTFTIALMIAAAIGCGNTNKNNSEKKEPVAEIASSETAENQETMLTGVITKKDLKEAPYSSWFTSSYEAYKPSDEELQVIKENINGYTIEAYMGTWCVDSRHEIPKLFKLLEEAGYDLDKMRLVAVDRSKNIPEGVENSASIEMVPTVIFYKDGKEVNRFVEYSIGSFEQDIAKIVTNKDYSNPYSD